MDLAKCCAATTHVEASYRQTWNSAGLTWTNHKDVCMCICVCIDMYIYISLLIYYHIYRNSIENQINNNCPIIGNLLSKRAGGKTSANLCKEGHIGSSNAVATCSSCRLLYVPVWCLIRHGSDMGLIFLLMLHPGMARQRWTFHSRDTACKLWQPLWLKTLQ